MRLITVVMGEESSKIRNEETIALLNYGFTNYKLDKILDKNDIIDKKEVILGKEKYVNITPSEDVNILNKTNDKKRNITYKLETNYIKAPLKKGDVVGKINILENNKTIMKINATVNKDIEKTNIFKLYIKNLLDIIKGSIH